MQMLEAAQPHERVLEQAPAWVGWRERRWVRMRRLRRTEGRAEVLKREQQFEENAEAVNKGEPGHEAGDANGGSASRVIRELERLYKLQPLPSIRNHIPINK